MEIEWWREKRNRRYLYSLYLKSDGSLWAMGWNVMDNWGTDDDGSEYPRGDRKQRSKHVTAGYQHSLYLKSDGSLWAMGRNNMDNWETGRR